MNSRKQAVTRTRQSPLAVVQSVSQRLSATLDLDTVLQCLVEEAAQTLEVKHVLVFLASPSGRELRAAAAHGFSPAEYAAILLGLNDRAPEAEAFHQGRAVLSGDSRESEQATPLDQLYLRHRVTSRLCVPLCSSGPALGVMSLGCAGRRRFSTEQVALIEAIAAQGALAIERVNLYDEMLAKRAPGA